MHSRVHTLRFCALGTLLLPLLAGCGGGGGGGGNGNSGGSGNNGGQQPLSITVDTPTHGLTATLSEDRATVAVGGTVTYTLTLTNPPTGTSLVVATPSPTLPAEPAAQLNVTDSAGNKVYDPIPPVPINSATLAPGQSLVETIPVQAFGGTGTYSATATFSFPLDSPPPTPTTVGPLTVTAQ